MASDLRGTDVPSVPSLSEDEGRDDLPDEVAFERAIAALRAVFVEVEEIPS